MNKATRARNTGQGKFTGEVNKQYNQNEQGCKGKNYITRKIRKDVNTRKGTPNKYKGMARKLYMKAIKTAVDLAKKKKSMIQ